MPEDDDMLAAFAAAADASCIELPLGTGGMVQAGEMWEGVIEVEEDTDE